MRLLPGAARPVRVHRPGASPRLLLAAALLLPAALLPGAASAAPERGSLVVEGQGGTTTEWTLTGAMALLADPTRVELSGGGPYAGVLLERVGGSQAERTGAVQVRAFADATKDVVVPLAVDNQLEPGRYRVTLLGQGPVRARYALQDRDREGLHVVPRTRIPVTFLGRAEQVDVGQSGARVLLPGALPAGRRAVQVALLDGTGVDDLELCATTEGSCGVGGRLVRVGTGDEQGFGRLHLAAPTARTLLWSVNGYRAETDRLRAAAIVF